MNLPTSFGDTHKHIYIENVPSVLFSCGGDVVFMLLFFVFIAFLSVYFYFAKIELNFGS